MENQEPPNFMQQLETRQMNVAKAAERVPEARYYYYRRCQVFRKGGEQCKAPAEKASHICYAHAGQLATAVRRERERRAVLAEAVAEMRRRGKPECEMTDLFTDFKGIQVTLAVVSRALIQDRIDCKTAGRLLMGLQMASKLLWMVHRKGREGRKENQESPQICKEERRSDKRNEPGLRVPLTALTTLVGRDIDEEDMQVMLKSVVSVFPARHGECRDGRCRDGPWQQARAA
jgi:hypothetical protein